MSALMKVKKAFNRLLDKLNNIDKYPHYTVSVNYDLTIEELIKANNFVNVNSNITSDTFVSPEAGLAEVVIYLVDDIGGLFIEETVKKLSRIGLRPATLKELLSLGLVKNFSLTHYVIASGSVDYDFEGHDFSPYIYATESHHRGLNMTTGKNGFGCYAAVHK